MPTLITGAGLVGTMAAARLLADRLDHPVLYDLVFLPDRLKNWLNLEKVTLVTGDVTDLAALMKTIRDYKVDRVIHTAARHTSEVREKPFEGARVNLMGTLAVFEAARLTGIKRVVFCSSSTLTLGLRQECPGAMLPEDFSLSVVSESPPSTYASLKLAAEWIGHRYRIEHALDFVAIRLAGVFGPWAGTLSSPNKLLTTVIESAWYGRPCPMATEDMMNRGSDYVYAHDAGQAAVKAAFANRPETRVYNIAMGRLYRLQEIIEIVEAVTGRRVDVTVTEGRPLSGYQNNPAPLDISHAISELGYEVTFPMEKAITDYVEKLSGGLLR